VPYLCWKAHHHHHDHHHLYLCHHLLSSGLAHLSRDYKRMNNESQLY
jgi:hypothetical protein